MTDGEILKTASEAGWNVEHRATNDYIIKFARELLQKMQARIERLEKAAEQAADVLDDVIADYEGERMDAVDARNELDKALFQVRGKK